MYVESTQTFYRVGRFTLILASLYLRRHFPFDGDSDRDVFNEIFVY